MTAYPKVVQVRVNRLDGDIHVNVFGEHRTVWEVKCFIDETVNIPCGCQRLIAGGCEVTDDETLANVVGMRRRRLRHKITLFEYPILNKNEHISLSYRPSLTLA